MVTNGATVLRIKHDVLYGVAKLAWERALSEKKENVPYKLIPGLQVRFRCCVYQERGIIRQRARLAEGLCPAGGRDTTNIVQVIGTAYEGCLIARFMVTGNCQLCMGKACQNSCSFGTTSMGGDRTYIDPDKCKEHRKCAQVCPYSAIADLARPCRKAYPVDAITVDENDLAEIDENRCIQYEVCIHGYPFDATGPESFMVDVIDMIRTDRKVVTMVAPATEEQFSTNITVASWKTALKRIDFADMVEVGLGGDLTAAAEAAEWAEAYRDGRKMTASCCPAFINMIRQHLPMLLENMSTTVSLMCAVSRMLKEKDPETVTVFIGPYITKKNETLSSNIKDNVDYTLTYSEVQAAMKAKNVNLEPEENIYQESSVFGKHFGNDGGMTVAVLRCLKETGGNTDIEVAKYDGAAEYRKALMLLKVGRPPEDFIKSMVCEGGCVGGPSKHRSETEARESRDILIGQADDRGVYANLKNLGAINVTMRRR